MRMAMKWNQHEECENDNDDGKVTDECENYNADSNENGFVHYDNPDQIFHHHHRRRWQ